MQEKILYTGGTFDLFHYGHVNFLRQCSKLCSNVVVALNTDEFVAQYKCQPIMTYAEREKSLLSCPYVSKVIPNLSGQDSKPTILSIKPDIIAIGDNWAHKDYYKQMNFTQRWLEEQGIVLVYIPYTGGISSSDIRNRILLSQTKVVPRSIAFVVSCKESKHIYSCVENINKIYNETADIIIVDSCSSDKKYFDLSNKFSNVFIEDICNKNYEYGAYMHGFKKYNNYDKYVFLQDSLKINFAINELNNMADDEVYVFGDDAKNSGWLWAQLHRKYFYDNHKNFPDLGDHFLLTQWNSFCINKHTFNKVINSELFLSAKPSSDKVTSCIWERVWSIIFSANNINMKTIDEKCYTKIFGNRQ